MCYKQTGDLYDSADEPFFPEYDLSDKPWMRSHMASIEVQTLSNISQTLVDIPVNIKMKMGHQLGTMMQQCTWDGVKCGPL